MPVSTESILKRVENEIRLAFPELPLEFSRQNFLRHVELWVYVQDKNRYEAVRSKCRVLSAEYQLDDQMPEIWLIAQEWSGPRSGGAEAELRNEATLERRRNEMLERIRSADLVQR